MTALFLALAAGMGVHLLWGAFVMEEPDLRLPSRRPHRGMRRAAERWLTQAGLEDLRLAEFIGVTLTITLLGATVTFAIFGSLLPAVLAGAFAGAFPFGLYRSRRRRRLERAQEAWPRIIEEIRILTGSVGRSIPQALFDAGERAPVELRGAFSAAHREWLITTDFDRTLTVLKTRAADPTADAACETLLVAHELGGSDLGLRLEALAEDRLRELDGRRDARAKQAGVRFARLFVLVVPLGMALAGLSIGDGRAAYRTGTGQILVSLGLVMVLACWWWASRYLRIPEPERVFDR